MGTFFLSYFFFSPIRVVLIVAGRNTKHRNVVHKISHGLASPTVEVLEFFHIGYLRLIVICSLYLLVQPFNKKKKLKGWLVCFFLLFIYEKCAFGGDSQQSLHLHDHNRTPFFTLVKDYSINPDFAPSGPHRILPMSFAPTHISLFIYILLVKYYA